MFQHPVESLPIKVEGGINLERDIYQAHIDVIETVSTNFWPHQRNIVRIFFPMLNSNMTFFDSTGDHKLLGDLLVLAGATLYGISNVCEEFIVKNLSRVEFLGMMGLFGSFFSGIQL